MTNIDRKKAFTVPQSVFKNPGAVVHCRELSHDDKVTVLATGSRNSCSCRKLPRKTCSTSAVPATSGRVWRRSARP